MSRNSEAIAEIVEHLKSFTKERTDIASVYLLGSVITDQLRSNSDIDIAILPLENQEIPLHVRLELASQLEAKLHRVIDIGVITAKNLIYASEAILKGRRVVTQQKEYTEAAETRLLGCYLTFRQDRRKVEASYHAA